MTDRQLMPVQAEVIKEILVDKILGIVNESYPGDLSGTVTEALDADIDLVASDGGALDLRMRRIGYLSRIAETDMFDAAKHPMEGLDEKLTKRIEAGDDWPTAASTLCLAMARQEPLPKPSPNNDNATSWKVPGPGGHVRHFVVAAAIAECLSGEENGYPEVPEGLEEAGELKRCWMYGFLVRCCEESLPPS